MINGCGRLSHDIFITGLHAKDLLLHESKVTEIHEGPEGR